MSRQWPVPPRTGLLHLMGDIHQGTFATRLGIWALDMTTGDLPTPVARVSVGDLTDGGLGAQDAAILATLATFATAPLYAAVGNHDVWSDVRTATQWAAAYGFPGRNYTVDLGFVQLIFIGPETFTTQLAAADLTYLDAQLAAAQKDCIVICHYPLFNTVLGGATEFQSIDTGFFVLGPNGVDDTQIRAILNTRARAKVWLSGHTHSNISDPGFITTVALGARSIVSINASAIPYTSRANNWNDPMYSLWMNYTTGVSMDIRYRNHGNGTWGGPVGGRVTTVAVPA